MDTTNTISERLAGLSDVEKWCVVQSLLMNLLKNETGRELAVCETSGAALVYLVPPKLRVELALNSQVKAELRQRCTERGECIPVADVISAFEQDELGSE